MDTMTPKEIGKLVLAAVDIEAIEEVLADKGIQAEVTITPDQNVRIRRNNPLQEFIVEVNVR